jgi:hypothetical protein
MANAVNTEAGESEGFETTETHTEWQIRGKGLEDVKRKEINKRCNNREDPEFANWFEESKF